MIVASVDAMTAELTQNAATGAPASSWKPYPAYKDSGVEWLGKVPKNWDGGNMKWLTNFHNYISYSNKHIYDLKALMYINSKVSVVSSGIL